MRVISFDPGYARLGWSIVDCYDLVPELVDFGTIETPVEVIVGKEGRKTLKRKLDVPERLNTIDSEVRHLLTTYKPEISVYENPAQFNSTNSVNLQRAIGVILLSLYQFKLPIIEYAPTDIKKVICNNGHADKVDIQKAVCDFFNLEYSPEFIKEKLDDSFDAVAIALTWWKKGGIINAA